MSSFGKWIIGLSSYIADNTNNLPVELHAIRRGLSLTREINFQDVICYSDFPLGLHSQGDNPINMLLESRHQISTHP